MYEFNLGEGLLKFCQKFIGVTFLNNYYRPFYLPFYTYVGYNNKLNYFHECTNSSKCQGKNKTAALLSSHLLIPILPVLDPTAIYKFFEVSVVILISKT